MDKKTNAVRKKESQPMVGRGRKGGLVFLDFDSFELQCPQWEPWHPGEAVPVHTALVLSKGSVSFANAYCQVRECQ